MAQVRHPVADPSRAKSFEGERTHHSSFLAAIHLHDIVAYCAKHCKGKTRLKEETLRGLHVGEAHRRIKLSTWGRDIKKRGLSVLLTKWLPRDPHASFIVMGATAIIGASAGAVAITARKNRSKRTKKRA